MHFIYLNITLHSEYRAYLTYNVQTSNTRIFYALYNLDFRLLNILYKYIKLKNNIQLDSGRSYREKRKNKMKTSRLHVLF